MMHVGHATDVWSAWGGDASSVVGLSAMAGVYAVGARRAWRHAGAGRALRREQIAAFAAGIAVLVVALLSPVDALADTVFAAHMTQHVLLAVIAPPLLVAGAPMVAALWALSPRRRRTLSFFVMRRRWMVGAWRFLTHPLVACGVHAVALWAWHAPRLYDAALRNDFAHFLEHASFVGTAALIWWSILHPRQPRRSAYALGIIVLFLTAMQSGALGALLTLSDQLWYPAQGSGAAVFGLTPLEDQQIAGLIMWVPGGLLYVGAMAALFVAWMRELGRDHPPSPVVVVARAE